MLFISLMGMGVGAATTYGFIHQHHLCQTNQLSTVLYNALLLVIFTEAILVCDPWLAFVKWMLQKKGGP